MNKRLLIILSVCIAFLSCNHKKEQAPNPAVPVNLFIVKKQNVLYYDNFPATTQALSQVDLHPQVQGYITGIFFKEGTLVKKGQKLYEIDKRLYQASYDQAAANVQVAEGNRTQAKQDADRYTYLNSHNAIARQVLDHAVITFQNAQSQVNAAEDALKTAKTNLGYATIYAPFDGIIGFSQVKLGDLVSVGTTLLNTISTLDPIAVDFLINEKQLTHYEDLQNNKGKHPDSLFTILLPDNSLYNQTGKISVIDRAVDPQTGSIRVRLVFPNPENGLKSGLSCTVREHNQDTLPQLVIPGKAIVEQMGEYFVFVAKDTLLRVSSDSAKKKGADTAQAVPKLHAFQRKVQVGQVIGPDQVIKEGIKNGDSIVVDGLQALHEGVEITTSKKRPPEDKSKRGN